MKSPSDYQVLARRYRPQTFGEILGQDAIVQTLKNAISMGRLAHAYLFSGSRGTGKTTTARIFAKALNCRDRSGDGEPCNACTSCREITAGRSLDVLEIDGASHRGIEDIRQINDTAGYATSSGGYKIYLIDEVHMLTKEAFNALLKTLEEPPEKVLFFFATTEPHKLLPTILSRCQRFHLNRISDDVIIGKLSEISRDLNLVAHEGALRMIAQMSEGGLRDAESLFDQVIAFHDGEITTDTVASVLGVASHDIFFALDQAGKEGDIGKAFDIVDTVFRQGKDLIHFVQSLIDHFRTLLLIKIGGKEAPYLTLSEGEAGRYEESAKLYRQDQIITIIDLLLEAQVKIRTLPSIKIALEALLMKIIQVHQRVPVEFLVKKLHELEAKASQGPKSFREVEPAAVKVAPPPKEKKTSSTVDPTPNAKEIPKTAQKAPPSPPKAKTLKPKPQKETDKKTQSRYDTLMQFAAVELEGQVERNR